jgi:hypothetical protein
MAILRTVEFWPQTGFVDAPWTGDRDEDSFVRSARSVGELYSEGIRAGRVEARNSQLRMFCTPHEPGRADVGVAVVTEQFEGFEMVRVTVPERVAALSPAARAALVLDVMHAAAVRLAAVRGWDPAAFEAAKAHVIEQGLRFRWTGPEKTAPGRRHVARPVFHVADDGHGRVVVEIRRVADGALVAASAEALTAGAESAFRRVARTLSWRDRSTVRIDPGDGWVTTIVEELPAVTAGDDEPDPVPEIRVVGGGWDDAVPEAYEVTLHLLLERLREPAWATWWAGAEDRVLEIWYDMLAAGARVTARRLDNKLRVRIDRPAADTVAAADPVALAYADVAAMLAAAQRRAGLGPHPDLPGLAEATAATGQEIERRAEVVRRMAAVLDVFADRLPAWLVTGLREDLEQGRTGEFTDILRFQLSGLGVTATAAELAALDAL